MIRFALPAAICVLGHATDAQTLTLPDISPNSAPPAYTCENTVGSQESCVRVLACVGDDGVYFDGVARGWDTGSVSGFMSDGVDCIGAWTSGGLGGTGLASLTCDGDLTADVIYYSQDGETGTVIGRGVDSQGRALRVWSGLNVLAFLSENGDPALPCTAGSIPIS